MWMHNRRPKWKERPPHEPPNPEGNIWGPGVVVSPEILARRRHFVRRFAGFLVFLLLSLGALLAGLFLLVVNAFERLAVGPGEAIFILCAIVPVALFLLAAIAAFVFRRLGTPLADLMTAADAVAGGDLSVRVPVRGHGDMSRLAGRFNHMTAELERADQGRRNLTADVAHELRTPIHIIQGNLEGVLDGVYEPTADHIAAMLDETRLLARLVEDLQTLSLAEAGQLPLHLQPVEAIDLLEDAATRFAAAAADAGVILKVTPDEDSPVVVVDPDRLDQALSNLVANALRHTPAGERITLSAAAVGGGVALVVADSGAGIDAADLPYIFDRFWRGDRSRARGGGGAGLGLPIARRLVEAHGGTIDVESEAGVGTTFTIWLPGGE